MKVVCFVSFAKMSVTLPMSQLALVKPLQYDDGLAADPSVVPVSKKNEETDSIQNYQQTNK